MVGPSTFSFSRPSKKSWPSPGRHDLRRPQDEQQLSKAERLLGTTGLVTGSLSRSQPNLATQLSFEVPMARPEQLAKKDEVVSPTRIEEVVIPPRFTSLPYTTQTNDSSDAPGNTIKVTAATYTTTPSSHTRHITNSRSSQTLKSFYDASKLPLEVSQQTSASAIRDRALRKGPAPILGKSELASRDTIARSGSMEGRDMGSASGEGDKKRPARLELSRLFAIPSFNSPRLFSPSKTSGPPSAGSHTSEYFFKPTRYDRKHSTTSINTTGRTGDTTRNDSQSFGPTRPGEQGRLDSNDFNDVKTNVRRPPRGVQNWFDGLLEEEDERDLEMEHEMATPLTELFSPDVARFSPSSIQIPQGMYSPDEIPSPGDSEFSDIERQEESTPKSSRTNETKKSRFTGSILSEVSILSTSSSEEEESEEESIGSHLPSMRDSIQVSEIDSILIEKAQAFHIKARRPPALNVKHGRQSSDESSRSATRTIPDTASLWSSNGSLHLTVPAQYSQHPQRLRPRKSGHIRQHSSIQEDSDGGPSMAAPSSSPPSSASMRGVSPRQGGMHKLMAVTEEEEALLEMMRRKRAAMATHSFAEGYKTALQKDPKSLPRTPPRKGKSARKDDRKKVSPSRTEAKAPIQTPTKVPRSAKHSRSTNREFRPLSSSSSILDSFPVSRSQRSSLIRSSTSAQTNIFMLSQEPRDLITSRRHGDQPESVISLADSAFNYSFPSLTLAPLDVSLSPIPSPNLAHSYGATSPSPEPLPSPSTPDTRRNSADVIVRVVESSHRDSQASYGIDAVTDELESIPIAKVVHRRSRTASSDANMHSSDFEFANGDAIDPALVRKGNRTSIASATDLAIRAGKQDSSSHDLSCRHYQNRGSKMYSREGLGYGPSIDTRCSVSEDVLAAWGSLGGWRA